jgi:hypothetical protein
LSNRKPRLCVDFDGVLHDIYAAPYRGRGHADGPPIRGAILFLRSLLPHFEVWILSARAKTWFGRRAIRRFITEHAGIDVLRQIHRVTDRKPPAVAYIDDRAVRFSGAFPDLDWLRGMGEVWVHDWRQIGR